MGNAATIRIIPAASTTIGLKKFHESDSLDSSAFTISPEISTFSFA